jgi:tetratricopeptide (TPR) repeat protein
MLSGSLVRRKVEGKDNYVFKLFGFVRHRPVPQKVSDSFSKEFSEVLPQRITFAETDELMGFDTTKQWIYLVIQYIVAIAAYVSFDFDLSLEMLRKLESDLGKVSGSQKNAPIITLLSAKVPKWKVAVISSFLQRQYFLFVFTRRWNFLESTEEKLNELESVSPGNYQGKLVRAILYFKKGMVGDAISLFEDEHKLPTEDATWRYSLGFLYAFEGKTSEAYEQYRRAFYGKTSPNVVNDAEIFIGEVINEYPEKIQLLYFRGLINYHAKGDVILAEQDFKLFLEKTNKDQFPDLQKYSRKYLADIQAHI